MMKMMKEFYKRTNGMTNEQKKQWYKDIYGCYYEKTDEYGNKEVIDPTQIRVIRSTVDPTKVIYKPPVMIYEHKSEPEKS